MLSNRTLLNRKSFLTGCMTMGVALSIGLQSQTSLGQTTNNNFSMLIGSDTQYPWTARTDAKDPTETEADKINGAKVANQYQVISMNSLTQQVGNVKGMILNGDVTAFGHAKELEGYKSIWKNLSVPIYIGLGNHDYANNVNNCFQNNCAIRMVEYARDEIRKRNPLSFDYRESDSYKFPEMRTEGIGSLAYSWDVGNIHFVQLNNYPMYQRTFEGYDAGAAKRKIMQIQSALDWLDEDLTKARNAGKAIILNYHDTNEHWADGYDANTAAQLKARFANMLQKYNVSAVFAGHYHRAHGRTLVEPSTYGNVPVFYAGSVSQGLYLLAQFNGNQMTIDKVSSAGGGVNRQTNGSYKLDMRVPNPPLPMPPKPGSITFFNQGGYVARYTLSYRLNGQPQSFSTGNKALGNKHSYNLPAQATDIRVRGEVNVIGKTWKDAFNHGINHPSGPLCFKTFGTTLNRKWNNSCN
jgi:cytolysin (calcineurin-like family phosphatase)